MAAPTDILATGYRPGSRMLSALHASGTSGDGPTGPDLLVDAAVTLPLVVGCGRARYVDLHEALYRAGSHLGFGRDRPHRLQAADECLDLLAAYLVGAGMAAPASRAKLVLGDWLAISTLVEIQSALAGAARYWRHEPECWRHEPDVERRMPRVDRRSW